MARTPDPSNPARPAPRRPAARARVAVTCGSVGALVGLTTGLALNAPSSGGEAVAVPAAPAAGRTEDQYQDQGDSWWERVGAEVGKRLSDEDEDDDDSADGGENDSWWDRVGAEVGTRFSDDGDDEGWSIPVPGRSAPQAPQTRSSGS